MRKYSKSDEVIVIGANIKLSVIIPVYQVEKHLRACLDSVLKSQSDNYEIILVDDGSKDRSPSICDEYRDRYPNITVIHQENGGLAAARNTGLEKAVGEYITFIDSDDKTEEGYIDFITLHLDPKDDIIAFSYYIDDEQTRSVRIKQLEDAPSVSAADALRALEKSGTFNMVWNKLYKREMLSSPPQVRFSPGTEPGEDLIFQCRSFEKAATISLVGKPFYHWIRRGEDTLANRFREDLTEKNMMFIDCRNRLYHALGTESSDLDLLSKGNLSYIFSCIPNMYRKGHVFKRKKRLSFYREIMQSPDVKKWVEHTDDQSTLIRQFIRLYRTGSPFLTDRCYSLASWARRTFDGLWQQIRKRMKK